VGHRIIIIIIIIVGVDFDEGNKIFIQRSMV